ncbi:BT_2262 family domain-containing protein [Flavobacterium agrisoli]|uniref:DUF5012 domain-containing protein n=1 Tax=Flavobacterium agrisoli TaxID=2793066 RepID=A0A934PPZ2_9FLAO|nr:BT_2262 family domain-containing protein [Flavobacterium agrisoli]MBK0370958.1 DUF5012 domain-containing protein [Flavobacterium agrisoli]
MKKLLLPIIAMCTILFTSCDSDSSNVSKVTFYPNFEMNGDSEVYLNVGESFDDPGVVATEDGAVIEYTTSVSGDLRGGKTLDTNVPDIYTVTYTAVNKDGFKGTTTRKVYVVDNGNLVDNISGLYTSSCTRNGTITPVYQDMKYVMIYKNADGTYQISDGIGLYYAVGRAYGPAYYAPAKVKANSISSNNYTYYQFTVGTFGGKCDMSGLVADPASQTVKFTTVWDSGYTFDVLLKKVQI